MNKEDIKNWKMFERARDKVQEMFYQLDGDAFSGEEIDFAFEEIENGFKQLKEFWEKNLKDERKKT